LVTINMDRKFGAFPGNGNERSRERGTKALHRELWFLGTKALGYEKSVILFFQVTFIQLFMSIKLHFLVGPLWNSSLTLLHPMRRKFNY